MWRFLYRGAWALARPLAAILAGTSGKLGRAAAGWRGAAPAIADWAARHRDTARPLVWFHAASVGEGRQAEAVIVRLRAARPDWQIAYTHSSPSAERFARTLPADFAGYVPCDTVADAGAALEALRPAALVFSATDVWPELVRQALVRGVPVGLISATLAPTSSRHGALARALLADAYAALTRVGAIDAADAQGLTALGVPADRVVVTGDTRHDAAATRAAAIDRNGEALRALATDEGAPVVVAGSTWPDDERALLPALAAVRARRPLRLVIAPHEPSSVHLADLERRLELAFGSLALRRLSALEEAARAGERAAWDVCVVDRVGLLAELYAAARIAFVGGGFHDAGLHAVIEPAAFGVPVVFGPRWQSSRDARLLLEAGGGACAAGRAALEAVIGQWLEDDDARAAAGAAARAVVERGLGAADRSLAIVLELVEPAAERRRM